MFHMFLFLKFLLIILFERQRDGDSYSIHWFTLLQPTIARTSRQVLEVNPGLSYGWQQNNYLSHTCSQDVL